MCHHGAISKLNHGMNLGLTLNDHVDKIEVTTEQMHRLNALQTLIHKGRGVNGDLGSHGPRGVRKGIFAGYKTKFVARTTKEGTTRTGKPNAVGLARIFPQIALVNGRVLGVDRNKLTGLRQRHQQVTADDERLFIGKGKTLIRRQGSMTCLKTSRTHNGHENAVDIITTRQLANGLSANTELGTLRKLLQHGVIAVSIIGHGNSRNRKLTSNRNELRSAGINRKRRHLQAIGVLPTNIKRLRANRTRAAQNCDTKTAIGTVRRLK